MVEGQMMQVLAEMSVISEQKAVSYDGVSVHGGEKNHVPHLSEPPMVDVYRQAFNDARSEVARQRVLRKAREDLDHAKRRGWGALEPERETFEWRCLIADDDRVIKAAAEFYSVSARTVSNYRQRYRGVMARMTEDADRVTT